MDRVKEYIHVEIEKIKNISGWKAKLEYIWEYYWIPIVAILATIFMIIFAWNQYFNSIKDYWFYVTFANTTADIGDDSDLYNGFVDYAGFDLTQKNVEFNNQAYFDYGVNETGNTYFESFITYTDAGTLDCVTMTCDQLELLGQSGRLLDLDSEECASIKEKFGDKFLYATPYDSEYSDQPVAIGIDISDSILMSEYDIYADSCAIGIGANTQNLEAVEAFLEYIYKE